LVDLFVFMNSIGVAREPRGHFPQKSSEDIVILCFKRRYPKQNRVICLKSSVLALPKFWAGYAFDELCSFLKNMH